MTRILILGGGGIIGQKLAGQLLAKNPNADITLHDIAGQDPVDLIKPIHDPDIVKIVAG